MRPRPTLARRLLERVAGAVGADLVRSIVSADQDSEPGIRAQRAADREAASGARAAGGLRWRRWATPLATCWRSSARLSRQGVWIIGGDGWAYDIGFGGLDHVLSSGRDVNILVLDTEVYSNTGGQASKATPRGSVAKFAAAGKASAKKDLGAIARAYGNVYVAEIALGANELQSTKALLEADAWPGPSLVIAYSTCIAHGIDMSKSMSHQKDAVRVRVLAAVPLPAQRGRARRPVPARLAQPSMPVADFVATEARFAVLARTHPERAEHLARLAQADVDERWRYYSAARRDGAHRRPRHRATPMASTPAAVTDEEDEAQ